MSYQRDPSEQDRNAIGRDMAAYEIEMRTKRGGDWSVEQGVMRLMQDLAALPIPTAKAFHWLKDVQRITRHPATGRITFHCVDAFTADRLFDHIGEALAGHFKHRNMQTVLSGRTRRVMSAPATKEPLSQAAKDLLRRAGLQSHQVTETETR